MTTPAAARADGRADDQLRPITLTRHWLDHAAGSVLVEFGGTKVLCAASASEGVPRWRKGSGLGWVTAEYAMLPASTNTRSDRESVKGRIGGRTHEISRLIGRSLRAVIDYKALGENTIVLDCDVLQADGGTRTAAITGAYVALADAVAHLRSQGALTGEPLTGSVAAVSVGIIDGVPRLDLPYEEDVRAETDMNVVMTGDGKFVEVQGTAEGAAFDRAELDALLVLAEKGCADLTRHAAGRARLDEPGLPGLAQRQEARRDAAHPGRARARPGGRRPRRRPGVRRAGRGRAGLHRQRAAQGPRRARGDRASRRSPTTAGCASTPSTACPASCPPAGPAPRRATSATTSSCSPSSPTSPTSAAGPTSRAPSRWSTRTGASWWSRAGWTAASSARCAAAGASATTCCSWPTSTRPRTSPRPSSTRPRRTAISHRGRALRDLAPKVADFLR